MVLWALRAMSDFQTLRRLLKSVNFDYVLRSSKSDYPWEFVADSNTRKCKVIIYVRVTERSATHWAMCFDWGDQVTTYEANEVGGYLIPMWSEGHPSDEFQWLENKRVTISCSPRDVNMKSKAVEINGCSCNSHRVNSQNWVVALSTSLGIKMEKSQGNQLPPLIDMLMDFNEAMHFGKKKMLKSSL